MARRLQRDVPLSSDAEWPSEPAEQARVVRQFYNEELRFHFQAEEKVLFPLVRPHLKPGEEIVEVLLRQHRTMQESIARLPSAGPNELKKQLTALGELLAEHIRLEEDDLFPLCETRIPQKDLEKAGTEMEVFR